MNIFSHESMSATDESMGATPTEFGQEGQRSRLPVLSCVCGLFLVCFGTAPLCRHGRERPSV